MDETETLQFDLRTDSSRRRDGEIERIIGEMNLGSQNPDDNDDDDLLSLMDKAT